jgi:hypothetical protein
MAIRDRAARAAPGDPAAVVPGAQYKRVSGVHCSSPTSSRPILVVPSCLARGSPAAIEFARGGGGARNQPVIAVAAAAA